eukprot:CAMPEP_0172596378 /NCGR_PEP_ID=MMETSP1068-20121228/16158_1 /TAXON_ID=35684 /ORGANISM="Pseudopedinella elastica, Strain CCMP716" /LENGTH=352 /DNA_ID=CAMNT_0013395369 /DNA_START=6 /DNA_END=1064 /DNA_ORIENTATION=-
MSAVLEQHSINRLNEDLAGRALDALRAYTEKTAKSKAKKDLFESDGEKVHMVVTLKRVPTQDQAGPKPIQLSLPHPVHGPGGDCDVCVFVKKDDKAWVKEFLIEGENPVEGVKKVITLDALRADYARFEQRRDLLASYDLFLADDRILPMLCKTLGKTFFSRKKQPVPVKVTRKTALPRAISKARASTYMFLSTGTCLSVCIGTTAMPRSELLANLAAALPAAVEKLPRKWKTVQSVSLKTSASVALPILNKLPFVVPEGALAAEEEQVKQAEEAKEEKEPREPKSSNAKPKKKKGGLSAETTAAVRKAAAAAMAEAGIEEADGAKRKRGSFQRKSKTPPTSNSKINKKVKT